MPMSLQLASFFAVSDLSGWSSFNITCTHKEYSLLSNYIPEFSILENIGLKTDEVAAN